MQLSVREVARFLNVSERTVYRWIDQKTVPVYRVNDQYRFNRSELLEWAASQRMSLSTELLDAHAGEEGAQLPAVSDALAAGGVLRDLAGSCKESVIRAVADALPLPSGADRDFLFQVLMARERLSSTGVGDGIAIPHARNPMILNVSTPMIHLGLLASPVDFGSIDGKPVRCLFTMLSTTPRAHLHLISRLSSLLCDRALRAILDRQAPSQEILDAFKAAEARLPVRTGEAGGGAR